MVTPYPSARQEGQVTLYIRSQTAGESIFNKWPLFHYSQLKMMAEAAPITPKKGEYMGFSVLMVAVSLEE